ncbi:MAG: LytTR family transcriptional regulator [Clostridiales bacterium]|nr:LytTR family transcriptional regulator [Clostridiales bacterium]
MSKRFEIFKKSYPYNDDLKQNTKLIFVISLILFVLFFLFQPFDLKALNTNEKYFLIGGLIGVTFFGLSINLLLIPTLLSKTNLFKHWTVFKEILWNIWIIFTIATSYFIYFNFVGSFSFSFYILIKVLIMSSIPVSILIPYNRNRLLRIHLQSALELNRHLSEKAYTSPRIIHFKSDYEKDDLSVDVDHLLYIRSANNYIEVFWEDNTGIHSRMVRSTLKYAEETCKDYPFIFRCHRTFIVNLNYIKRVEGNSQGYILYVGKDQHPLSVSRNYIQEFKELFFKI